MLRIMFPLPAGRVRVNASRSGVECRGVWGSSFSCFLRAAASLLLGGGVLLLGLYLGLCALAA